MQLGNPSNATADTNNHNHFLLTRTVEAIDYSDNLGEPNWASWDLTAADIGNSGRTDAWASDTNLPPNFYPVPINPFRIGSSKTVLLAKPGNVPPPKATTSPMPFRTASLITK